MGTDSGQECGQDRDGFLCSLNVWGVSGDWGDHSNGLLISNKASSFTCWMAGRSGSSGSSPGRDSEYSDFFQGSSSSGRLSQASWAEDDSLLWPSLSIMQYHFQYMLLIMSKSESQTILTNGQGRVAHVQNRSMKPAHKLSPTRLLHLTTSLCSSSTVCETLTAFPHRLTS